MKVLITGGSGLLGAKLREIFEENKYDVYVLFHNKSITGKNYFQIDITQKDDVFRVLKKVSPDVVVHTAAYTNVDECEKDKDTAFAVNVQGTKNVANATEKLHAKFVYISTDYVFNGNKGRYKEEDTTDPIDYYGITKLEGEKSVTNVCSDFVIARPSVIYGAGKKNFVTWAIDMLKNKKNFNIVNDQYVSPTFNVDLAKQLVALIDQDETGIFHTAGGERISRYDFVKNIADIFHFEKTFINPIKMDDMNWIARRPKDSSLDVSKISKFKKPYLIRESLNLFKEEIVGQI
jgi:dTDP-4-dehydrorhamnose reductase